MPFSLRTAFRWESVCCEQLVAVAFFQCRVMGSHYVTTRWIQWEEPANDTDDVRGVGQVVSHVPGYRWASLYRELPPTLAFCQVKNLVRWTWLWSRVLRGWDPGVDLQLNRGRRVVIWVRRHWFFKIMLCCSNRGACCGSVTGNAEVYPGTGQREALWFEAVTDLEGDHWGS